MESIAHTPSCLSECAPSCTLEAHHWNAETQGTTALVIKALTSDAGTGLSIGHLLTYNRESLSHREVSVATVQAELQHHVVQHTVGIVTDRISPGQDVKDLGRDSPPCTLQTGWIFSV